MKYFIVALVAVLSFFITVPAHGAKGSNTPTGTIELLAPLAYGKPVVVHWTFTGKETTSPRLRIQTVCTVGGDSMENIVIGWADSAYDTTTYFPNETGPYLTEHVIYDETVDRTLSATTQELFAGYGLYSKWDTEHTTENADCTVTLYEWKGQKSGEFIYYDSVTTTAIR